VFFLPPEGFSYGVRILLLCAPDDFLLDLEEMSEDCVALSARELMKGSQQASKQASMLSISPVIWSYMILFLGTPRADGPIFGRAPSSTAPISTCKVSAHVYIYVCYGCFKFSKAKATYIHKAT
jgi:hypothetical protein